MYLREPLEQYLQQWFWNIERDYPLYIFDVKRKLFFPIKTIELKYNNILSNMWRIRSDDILFIDLPIIGHDPSNDECAILAKYLLEHSIFNLEHDNSNDYFIVQKKW